MRRRCRGLCGVAGVIALALAGCSGGPAADLSDLAPGWNTIHADGDTMCSDGSPYRFLARPGDPDKLLIYLQGGGACWDGVSCDTDLEPTPYTVNLDALDPMRAHGIFAFDEPENPFAEHSVVMAPYCSGDVHLGDSVATYDSPGFREHAAHRVTVNHKGLVNVESMLEWTYDRFRAPNSIFVTGSSAGSIPSPYFAMRVAEHYPAAEITQLGDGSGGYRAEVMQVAPVTAWGTVDRLSRLPEFASLEPKQVTSGRLYIAAANHAPQVRFAAFDHAEDSVQKDFLELAGAPRQSLLPLIVANQEEIRNSVAGFRSYIGGGDLHTILLRPEFYRQHVDGVRIRDWVAALAVHTPVQDVRCTNCTVGQFLPSR